MARPTYPSDKQDQYMLRFPDGLRDRIKEAAEANGRSMNAEIIQRLEESFEERDLDSQAPDTGLMIAMMNGVTEAILASDDPKQASLILNSAFQEIRSQRMRKLLGKSQNRKRSTEGEVE